VASQAKWLRKAKKISKPKQSEQEEVKIEKLKTPPKINPLTLLMQALPLR
jgi:hypothetical protein